MNAPGWSVNGSDAIAETIRAGGIRPGASFPELHADDDLADDDASPDALTEADEALYESLFPGEG